MTDIMRRVMQRLALGKARCKDQKSAKRQRSKDVQQALAFHQRKGKRRHIKLLFRQPRRNSRFRCARPVSWLAGRRRTPPSQVAPVVHWNAAHRLQSRGRLGPWCLLRSTIPHSRFSPLRFAIKAPCLFTIIQGTGYVNPLGGTFAPICDGPSREYVQLPGSEACQKCGHRQNSHRVRQHRLRQNAG